MTLVLPVFAGRPATPRFSSILVHAGLTRECAATIKDAAQIANTFGARLVGVSTSSATVELAYLRAVEQDAAQRLLEAAGERFARLSSTVHAGFLWKAGEGSRADALAAFGWAADLIILSRQSTDDWDSWRGQLQALVRRVAGPVLVRPQARARVGLEHIVIVWDETRACHRAVNAALPFLGRAASVTLLAPPWRRRRQRQEAALEAVRRGLLTREVLVRLVRLDSGCQHDAVFESVQALEPDLVVMAAWPHGAPWALRNLTDVIVPKLSSYGLLSH